MVPCRPCRAVGGVPPQVYRELRSSPAVRDFVRRIAGKDTVTLLYASKNAAGNHALILQEYLARATAAAGVTNVRYS